jgi:two-component system, OmpR family, KDP operon response regulator KdpE
VAAEAPGSGPGISAAPPQVLVVDDEPAMLRALGINLRVGKYDVPTAATGREALAEARWRPPDAVILDLRLPDMHGIEVIRGLRVRSHAPVIVLSGRTGADDKIAALDAGADDHVTKPFSMDELLARLRAALRRDDTGPPPVRVKVDRCEIDLAAHTALEGDTVVRLTPTQWRLLEILLRHPGQLVGTQRLLTEIWGPG